MAPCPLCRTVINLVCKMVGSLDCAICYQTKEQNMVCVPCGHTYCVGCMQQYLDTFTHVTWHDTRNPEVLEDALWGIANADSRSTVPMTPPLRAVPVTPPRAPRPLRFADLPPQMPAFAANWIPPVQFLGPPFEHLGAVVSWYYHDTFEQYCLVLPNRMLAQPPYPTPPSFTPDGFRARWVAPNNRANRRWVLDVFV